jgi:hypothetical protein
MSDNHPNYREAYFQHPTLTKISGDPTYTSLAKLKREIKDNGKSVPSTKSSALLFMHRTYEDKCRKVKKTIWRARLRSDLEVLHIRTF